MAFLRGRVYWTWAAQRDGRRKRISLGTTDKPLAREIERMLKTLGDRREWEILEAVTSGEVSAAEVYDYWSRDELPALRARLNDVDLSEYVEPWRTWLGGRVAARTAEKYAKQLRLLIPEGAPFLRSQLTRSRVAAVLHELETKRSGSTVRRYHAACSSFFRYLIDIEVLDRNPVQGIRRPRENPARERWLTLELSIRLVDAHTGPYRALAALREGAGVEIGAALRTRRRDIDRERRTVHIHGTKTTARDRIVKVDEWAWPALDEHARSLLPDALLWPDITYDAALHRHRLACKALKIENYRIHDARHSYAVRHMKAGDDPILIANNLGHTDGTMVLRVYGKYRPTPDDYRRLSGGQETER